MKQIVISIVVLFFSYAHSYSIEFSEQDIEGKSGRDALAKAIAAELNTKLQALEGFGGIENVHFTSFMLQ